MTQKIEIQKKIIRVLNPINIFLRGSHFGLTENKVPKNPVAPIMFHIKRS